MARAIAERMARAQNMDNMAFDSAGVQVRETEGPTVEAASFLHGEKFNILAHRSKPLTPHLADGSDVIFCMTAEQTKAARKLLGPELAPKVVLFNEGIDLTTKRMDIPPPGDDSVASLRRIYAVLSASVGRLVRTLEDPHVNPEYFGAKSMPRKFKPHHDHREGHRVHKPMDPEKRFFLANMLFDLIEWAYEPATTTSLLEALKHQGHGGIPMHDLEELLRQDLHGYVRVDKDGVWHTISGAQKKRRDTAKAQSRASKETNRKPAPHREEKLTEKVALEVLGITLQTTVGDARKKYRTLLKRYHPDKFHDDPEFRDMAEHKARRINEAWDLVEAKLPRGGGGDFSDTA